MMMILMGILFMSSIQPMMMIMSLIIISMMYSLYIYMSMGSFWFSYLLLLVMLSGVLVVFTYMVSLFPNESFEMYNLLIIMMMCVFSLYWIYDMFGMDYSYISLNMWFFYMGIFSVCLVSFLLMVMVMVVWMSYLNEGAIYVK
uniref:NADH dehydrogenase subunit 6 n=1 Tax=Amaurobius fenestralis TaxID=680006 RepID=A0A7L7S1J2_9ARAC|nr:NADH dehydrogenase subunit 6 [Amaurobius fenestralis]